MARTQIDKSLIASVNASAIVGTTTNDSAAAGKLGQFLSVAIAAQSAGTTATYADLTSISLTAGDWDLSALAVLVQNGATTSGVATIFLGQVAGNNTTGASVGDNLASFTPPTATNTQTTASIPVLRISVSTTTTVYLKGYIQYTVATPQWYARISARRVR